MEVEIKDRKYALYVSEGDVFEDTLSSVVYLTHFKSYDDVANYSLLSLSGSGSVFEDRDLTEEEIKQFIYGNRLVHYPKDEYQLSLIKRED